MLRLFYALLALHAAPALAAEQQPLGLDDPSGESCGSLTSCNKNRSTSPKDKIDANLWPASWDGSDRRQITHSPESETTPRWSPDGRWLAFLSSRAEPDRGHQAWLMPVAGGEARQVTHLEEGASDLDWSPDGKRLVLIANVLNERHKALAERKEAEEKDQDKAGSAPKDEQKRPEPIVIDGFYFKEDESGFLHRTRSRLMLLDVASGEMAALTAGDTDEVLPAFSPDGSQIAFVTKRGEDPDRRNNWDIFLIDARQGAEPRRLTSNPGTDAEPSWGAAPCWRPEGMALTYQRGGDPALIWYALQQVGVIPAAGGAEQLPTAGLDRNTTSPAYSPDGRWIYFLLEDDRSVQLARVPAAGGEIERLTPADAVVYGFSLGPRGFQRAADRIRADVSGAAQPGRVHPARDLSGGGPQHRSPQLPA